MIQRAPLRKLFWYGAVLLLAALFFAPVAFMIAGSLKPNARVLVEAGDWHAFWPTGATLANYRAVFARVDFLRYLGNSLYITGLTVLCGLPVNALAGYAFARLDWRGREWLLTAVLAVMIIPIEAIAVPLFYGISVLGWRNTYTAQIAPFIANAFSIYLFYTWFLGLPRELEEAARLDGAGPLRTFVSIIAPNARPVFASVAILTFLTQWSAYLWPLLVTTGERVRPLPLAIANFYTLPPLQWGDIFAFGVMMVSPVVLVFLIFQRAFVRGVAATGLKG